MTYYSTYPEKTQTHWNTLLGDYGRNLLWCLNLSASELEDEVSRTRTNPIVYALRTDPNGFVQLAEEAGCGKGVNIIGICRTATIAQMYLYDLQRGPEKDGKPKALRRHWYAWFKPFAQMLAFALGKTEENAEGNEEMKDVQWTSRLSQVYADFVDRGEVTYKDLWVQDASRMTKVFDYWQKLVPGLELFICVEKDSLFGDFTSAAESMGASAIISGKGKNSKAATELMLRELGWRTDHNPFADKEVVVLHLSDHDMDGEGVIGPTFAEQMRRYHAYIKEARIGVKPEQVIERTDDAWVASYQVKLSNKGYKQWAYENALWWARCEQCGHEQFVIGTDKDGWSNEDCSHCGSQFTLVVDSVSIEQPHGFEVEALQSSDYYALMVEAFLDAVDWDWLIEQFRWAAAPTPESVISDIKYTHLEQVSRYQKINEAISTLEDAKFQLEMEVHNLLEEYVADAIRYTQYDWYNEGADPDPGSFERHVVSAGRSGYGGAWRPFNVSNRNKIVAQHLEDIEELQERLEVLDIEDFDAVVDQVNIDLS